MRAHRWVPLVVAGALLGSGCGVMSPGTASVVDGQRISDAEVREVTAAFCDVVARQVRTGQGQPVPLAQQKQQLLGVLIQTRLDRAFAEDRDVTPPAEVVTLLSTQLRQSLGELDDRDAEVLGGLVDDLAEGQAALAAVAAQESGTQVSADNLDQLQQAGLQLRQQWQSAVTIETDPRYAPDADGVPGGGSVSVSQAVSPIATQAAQAAQGQDPGYAASLPRSQRCGG